MEKAKILLVDDRPENLLALEGVLRGDDRHIFRAGSGREALELLMTHAFALAILDVQMPELNGFEVAELMRSCDETQHIPIIFVTAGVRDAASTFKGFEAGAVDFLHKPLDERIVRSKVQVFLDLDRKTRLLQEKVAQLEASRKALEESKAALSRSNQDLERFAYIASHDIREPLRMISMHLSLLTRFQQGKLSKEAQDCIDFAVSGAKRLATLVESLVTHSKVRQEELVRAPTDVGTIVREVLGDLRMAIEEKQAVVEVGELPTVHCHPTQLRQLFQNLLSNAVKFSNGKTPLIRVSSRREERAWLFEVQDNGIGIAPDQLESVFEPFVRGHSREQYAGDGIGLSVCKTIVERHGGTLSARSRLGEGSVFQFSISDG